MRYTVNGRFLGAQFAGDITGASDMVGLYAGFPLARSLRQRSDLRTRDPSLRIDPRRRDSSRRRGRRVRQCGGIKHGLRRSPVHGRRLVLDHRKSRRPAVLPRRRVRQNPLGRHAVRIRMRNGECSVGDFAHAREALDIERVVGEKRSERESLSDQRRLFRHEVS